MGGGDRLGGKFFQLSLENLKKKNMRFLCVWSKLCIVLGLACQNQCIIVQKIYLRYIFVLPISSSGFSNGILILVSFIRSLNHIDIKAISICKDDNPDLMIS